LPGSSHAAYLSGDRDLSHARPRLLFRQVHLQGIGLGAVTATLLAGVLIGQIGITIAQTAQGEPSSSCSCSPSANAVGPQFVRGVAKDGLPQAIFAAVQCVFSLGGRPSRRESCDPS